MWLWQGTTSEHNSVPICTMIPLEEGQAPQDGAGWHTYSPAGKEGQAGVLGVPFNSAQEKAEWE